MRLVGVFTQLLHVGGEMKIIMFRTEIMALIWRAAVAVREECW